jgi:hypothetical protein
VIAGGIRNQASSEDTTIAGVGYNIADEIYATIGGGTRNQASGTSATVSGGSGNLAAGSHASIIGGLGNLADGNYSAVLGGHRNGANGDYSLTLGGLSNQAEGDFSIASGRASQVAADHHGTFLFADSSDFPFHSIAANEFALRASGGIRMISGIDQLGEPMVGVILPAGSGSWEILSTRSVKEDLQAVRGEEILASLMDLPPYTWSYRLEPDGVLHIGPTAEDFHSAFNLGNNPKTIATVDADGIALAALQELGHQLQIEQQARTDQEESIQRIEVAIARLQAANRQLEQERTLLLFLSMLLGFLLLRSTRMVSRND